MSRCANAADCVPSPVFIAGTQLQPFCLGHHMLFKKYGLPFAGCPEADCDPSEILIGAFICARKYQETLTDLLSGELAVTQKKWLKRVSRIAPDMAQAEVAFRKHLTDGYRLPPLYHRPNTGGVKLSAPWEVLLKVRLMANGYTEDEVVNGYLPSRWYEYFAAIEISASESCTDAKNWRGMFFTPEDAQKLDAIKCLKSE